MTYRSRLLTFRSRYGIFVDPSRMKHLVWMAVIWTLGFPIVFYLIPTMHNKGNGVHINDHRSEPIHFWPALGYVLYFSVATETTLGYGDLSPQGWSCLFACIEAIGGLMLAGGFVTRLTTGPSGKTKVLVENMTGDWLELCAHPKEHVISLITIQYADSLLRYDGMNYDTEGRYLRGFKGSSQPLSTLRGAQVWFDYSNEGGDKHFSVGKTFVNFSSTENSGDEYASFVGHIEDKEHTEDVVIIGVKLSARPRTFFDPWNCAENDSKLSTMAKVLYDEHRHVLDAEVKRRHLDVQKGA